MQTELTFTIPLPPRELSPNGSHRCWQAKARAAKGYRESCGYIASQARTRAKLPRPVFGEAEIQYTVYVRRDGAGYLPRDGDNAVAALKAAQDGFKDAGLFHNDSKQFVRVAPVQFVTPKRSETLTGVAVRIVGE